MNKETLTQIGFTKAESIIYLSLLKIGSANVRDISRESGFHRTNIYDTLERLREKGLVVTKKVGKTLQYKTSDIENLYNILRERQEKLDNLLPDLKKIESNQDKETEVVFFKGEEGMKSAYRDILRVGKTIYTYSATGQFREFLPFFADEFLRKQKLAKIEYYGIYADKKSLPRDYKNVKLIPKELAGPVTTTIYGENVMICIWHPTMIAIIIKSKAISENYKKHFDLLWKIAKSPQK